MALFEACRVEHIPRSKNKKADALSKLASVSFNHLAKEVRVEVLATPSIAAPQVMQVEVPPQTWLTPIINYLVHDVLPTDKAEARKVQINSLQYQMQEGGLYRKTFLGPLLKCLDPEQASYIIREIHYGICGIHAGPKMIVTKVKNAGYYWPGMHESAVKELQQCDECQRHAPTSLRAKNEMIPVTAAWPFQKWGVDIVGPFIEIKRKRTVSVGRGGLFHQVGRSSPVYNHLRLQCDAIFLGANSVPIRPTALHHKRQCKTVCRKPLQAMV
ncbi:putative integrase zinc-binding domain-containing protein [Helianthus annuus]|nr:putative integrase zinc-binding domain-containing protein [Helianthus annuus]